MSLAKKIAPKKIEPSSGKQRMAPYKNDCLQKNPGETIEDKKWHLTKKTAHKKTRAKQLKINQKKQWHLRKMTVPPKNVPNS